MLQTSLTDSITRLRADIVAGDQQIELVFMLLFLLIGILLGWLIGYFSGVKEGRKQEIAAAKRYGGRAANPP